MSTSRRETHGGGLAGIDVAMLCQYGSKLERSSVLDDCHIPLKLVVSNVVSGGGSEA